MTLVISAEYDSLCGEEKMFTDRAAEAGTDVTYKMFPGCRHGFTHEEFSEYMPEQAEQAWQLMADFLIANH